MNDITPSETLKTVEGSFLQQLQQRDSVLIADQLRYGFRLDKVQDKTGLSLPDYSEEEFAKDWEVVESWTLDTLKVYKAKKDAPASYDIQASIVVTTFEEGEYELPPLAVIRQLPEGKLDTLLFNSQKVDVKTMPVDTATFVVHDIKPQIKYPITFKEVLPYVGGAFLLAALIAMIVAFVKRRQKNAVEAAKAEPAHIVALRELDKYRGDKLWVPEKQKGFYSGVTDALREYLDKRYGVSAMEMTTKEIMDGLKGKDIPDELLIELKDLLERADYVKFAKYVANNDENATVVPFAVRFVTQTYQAEIEKEV
jgi:hypothetical protein